jgi:hypothetical protein
VDLRGRELKDGRRMVTVARWRNGAIAEEYIWIWSQNLERRRREMNISLSDAAAIVDQAMSHADAMSTPMNITVVDGGGHLIAFARMDLKEHWDVIEDEATRANSLSGLPTYGDTFPEER